MNLYSDILYLINLWDYKTLEYEYDMISLIIFLDDEILTELNRCQAELRAVSAHNHQQLKRLVKLAREELARQEIRNK